MIKSKISRNVINGYLPVIIYFAGRKHQKKTSFKLA
jgi:ribosomal protein S17E